MFVKRKGRKSPECTRSFFFMFVCLFMLFSFVRVCFVCCFFFFIHVCLHVLFVCVCLFMYMFIHVCLFVFIHVCFLVYLISSGVGSFVGSGVEVSGIVAAADFKESIYVCLFVHLIHSCLFYLFIYLSHSGEKTYLFVFAIIATKEYEYLTPQEKIYKLEIFRFPPRLTKPYLANLVFHNS